MNQSWGNKQKHYTAMPTSFFRTPRKPITSSCWRAFIVMAVLGSRVQLTEQTRVSIGVRRISLGAESSKRIRIWGGWILIIVLLFKFPSISLSSNCPSSPTDRSTVWEPAILFGWKTKPWPCLPDALTKRATL